MSGTRPWLNRARSRSLPSLRCPDAPHLTHRRHGGGPLTDAPRIGESSRRRAARNVRGSADTEPQPDAPVLMGRDLRYWRETENIDDDEAFRLGRLRRQPPPCPIPKALP